MNTAYWIAAITGFAGTLGVAGLFLIPGAAAILSTAMTVMTPILKGIAELLVWFVKTVWEGFIDIIDNIATIVTVLSLVAGFSLYYKYYGPERQACEVELQKVVKQSAYWKAKANGR